MFLSRFSFCGAVRFGFSSMGEEKFFAVEHKADGNDVRLAGCVRRRKVADAGGAKQAQGACGQFQSFQSFQPFQASTLTPID